VKEQALGKAVRRIVIILDNEHVQLLVRSHGDTSRNKDGHCGADAMRCSAWIIGRVGICSS
jgi:hypothetical protein